MFGRFFRPLWQRIFTPKTLITTSTLLTYSLLSSPLCLDSPPPPEEQPISAEQSMRKNLDKYLKNLKILQVCDSKDLREGQKRVVTIQDHLKCDRKIMITKLKGKLYAFMASCTHQQPFSKDNTDSTLQNAVIFNDKLYCPHHGCIFDIKSGSVQHGPAVDILPIFKAQDKNGKVTLIYPQAVPTSVAANYAQRDVQDLRKVLVLGGDDAATVGCLNSLRQFGYQGQITVVKQGPHVLPYKKEYLHKSLLNMHLNDSKPQNDTVQKANNIKETDFSKLRRQSQLSKKIEQQLQQKIYKKLRYYPQSWYQQYGVDFVFTDEAFRIINKQYYPYVTFNDGTKMEFDTLMVATGLTQKIPTIQGITINQKMDLHINLPENVFCPLRSKQQHGKLHKFLNKHTVQSLLVLGHNIQSLEFVEAFKRQFPQIKVTVVDTQADSQVSELLGPQLQKSIVKEFTQRGVQFFIKIKDDLFFSNRYSYKNIKKRALQLKQNKKNAKKFSEVVQDPKKRYNDSVVVRISDELRVKADGVIIFPHQFAGNTQWVKNGKYTDFEYFHNDRLGGDNFCRTDNIRIFSAGLCSTNQYYLLNKRLVTSSGILSYQQGFNTGLNMQALRIPFTYVPFQKFDFFGKQFFYVGMREFFDSVLVIGSIEDWDFLTIYALGSQIKAVAGSPSKSKQLAILREAYRVNCMPTFEEILSGYWSVDNLANLINELKRSGCYRDVIFSNRQNIHKKDLVWMQRTADAGFENDRPQNSQEYPSMQVGADGKLKEL